MDQGERAFRLDDSIYGSGFGPDLSRYLFSVKTFDVFERLFNAPEGRISAMQCESDHGARALELMTEALATLDESALPANIGAHLDMAIGRLRQHIGAAETQPEGRVYAVG